MLPCLNERETVGICVQKAVAVLQSAGIPGEVIVADNGSRSGRLKPGSGLRIVSELAKGLGGRIHYEFGSQFSSFILSFALTERERRANRTATSRRTKQARERKLVSSSSQPREKQRVRVTDSPLRRLRAS